MKTNPTQCLTKKNEFGFALFGGAAELETLVRGLREPYGRIAVLYFLEHRETAEIAKLVGRPPATVNSQLWRAKLLLRQQITERRQKE